jgi:hypothetical protein
MARFTSMTFGSISGRHGSAVAVVMKNNTNVLKVYNAPYDPKSEDQLVQRSKFGFVVSRMARLHAVFKITFLKNGGHNHGVSLAFKTAVTGSSPDFSIDYSKLIVSQGSVCVSKQTTVQKTTGIAVMVNWSTKLMDSSIAKDWVSLVFFQEEEQQAVFKQNCTLRSAGTFTMDLPKEWAGGTLHSWIYFSTPNGSRNSLSSYISGIQL